MRNRILVFFFVLLVRLQLHRKNIVIHSPEIHHMDQEGPSHVIGGPPVEGIVETTPQPAEIPLIFRILYPWAVPRAVIRRAPETSMKKEGPRTVIGGSPESRCRMEEEKPRTVIGGSPESRCRMEEEYMKRTEQPVEETVRGMENGRPEPITWISFLTRPPFWFSLAILICFLVLKYVLRQNDLTRTLGCYLMFLELSGFIYLLIDIWSSRGTSYEDLIPELISWISFLPRPPFWFSWAVLICVLILKYVLRRNDLARRLGRYLTFLQLSAFIYLVIAIWNNRGTSFENLIPELISLVSFLTHPPFWFSWAFLICVLMLKLILRQNYLARISGHYLTILELSGIFYLLIDIWNRWGPGFENTILELIHWCLLLTFTLSLHSWTLLICFPIMRCVLRQDDQDRALERWETFLQLCGFIYPLIYIWNRRGLIGLISLPTSPSVLLSLALLISVLILKHILRQNYLATILALFLMLPELCAFIYLLIDIWNSMGTSFENVILKTISWISFLPRTLFWFSWAVLICVLILKYVLRQNYRARTLGHYLMFLELCALIYQLINIWNIFFGNLIPEQISWIPFLASIPSGFRRVVLTCILMLKHILSRNNLVTILGLYLIFLEVRQLIYTLVNIWNSRGTSIEDLTLEPISVLHQNYLHILVEYYFQTRRLRGFIYRLFYAWNRLWPAFVSIILLLLINSGDWYQWVVTGLWSVWSKGCVALENTVQPVLINIFTEHRSECFLGLITVLVVLLLIYFKPFYRLFRPTSSNITPLTSDANLPASGAILPATEDTILPATEDTILPATEDTILPSSKNAASAMEETHPTTPEMYSGLSPQWRTVLVHPSGPRHRNNVDSSMEETDVPVPSVTPPRVSLRAKLSRRIKKLKSKMVIGKRNIFPRKGDFIPPTDVIIPPTSQIAERAMEETDVSIPSVTPPRVSLRTKLSRYIKKLKSKMVIGKRNIFPRKGDVIIPPTSKNAASAMEETDVPVPSVTPPRDHSDITPQNGGLLSLPSSLMSPVTDDINMLLDSSISQQRATLAVVPNVETRNNQTRLHKPTKEDRQES